jgi:anaerobic C4-dicarboxylate transporter DcuA
MKRGKELNDDPEFLERLKDPEFAQSLDVSNENEEKQYSKEAKTSVILFTIGIIAVVLFGSVSSVLPNFAETEGFEPNFVVGANGKIRMAAMIEMTMLGITGLIILLTKTSAAKVAKASLFNSAATATIAVFGVVWMSATFMDANRDVIESGLGGIVTEQPWTFAIALFILAALLFSQAATTKALMPLGVMLGIPYPMLIAFFPAVSGDFVIPGYPTLLAAINMDRTGTTKIGKYVLNHSFMLPGLVTTVVSIVFGILLVQIF